MRDNAHWTPQRLTWVALLMAWAESLTLQARFRQGCEVSQELHAHWRLGNSYGGFTTALIQHSASVIPGIVRRLQQQMRRIAGGDWLVHGWCAFSVDGTRLETPHTIANEAGLGCAGREKSAPQVFLTSLWHMGLGLPWEFRSGPGADSERHHLLDMLGSLPAHSLLVADAGFCGYELCQKILAAGHSFLLRVGSNVTLLTELGYHFEQREGVVYLWPDKFYSQPPLVLRLMTRTSKKQTMYLLTNVLSLDHLSDEDAADLYQRRWNIEVGYRSYKQTLARRRLLSRTPTMCLLESQWTMLGLWLLGLLCVRQLTAKKLEPACWSTARARDVVREAMRHPHRNHRRNYLVDRLSAAIQDRYRRIHPKDARNYPRKKREKPPGPPKIKPATSRQIRQAMKLRNNQQPIP